MNLTVYAVGYDSSKKKKSTEGYSRLIILDASDVLKFSVSILFKT